MNIVGNANELILEIEATEYQKIFVNRKVSFTLIRRVKELSSSRNIQDPLFLDTLLEIKKFLELFHKPNDCSPTALLSWYHSIFNHRQSYLKSFQRFNEALKGLVALSDTFNEDNHQFENRKEDCQDAIDDLQHLLNEVGKLRFQLMNDPTERSQFNSLVEQISTELSEWTNVMTEIVELKQHTVSLPSLLCSKASSSSSGGSRSGETLRSELIYVRRLIEDLQQNSLTSQPQQIQMIDSLNESIINAINENEIALASHLKQEIDSVKSLTAKFHEEIITLLKQQSQGNLQQILLQTSGHSSPQSYTQIQQSLRDEKLKHLRIQSSEIVVGEESLGMGSFGEVRVGQYGNLPVAIKILQFNGSEKEKLLIENEALLMSLCHHPSILQIYGICYPSAPDCHGNSSTTTAYILMELGRLGSLWSYLNGDLNPLTPHHDTSLALSLAWMSDIFSALSYLHQKKIIHRDVKAENVLLTLQLNCKLTDFGFAKQQLGSTSGSSSSLKGSFHFMAPEVKLTQKYSHRSDVYAACVTAYQILSRSAPPIHETRKNILLHASTFSPALSTFFNSCLQENPRDRISSAEALKLISEMQQNEPDPRHTPPSVGLKIGLPVMPQPMIDTQPSNPVQPPVPPPPPAPPSDFRQWIENELSSYSGLTSLSPLSFSPDRRPHIFFLFSGKPGFEIQINRLIKIFEDDFIFSCEEIFDHRDLYTKEYFRTRDIPLGIASVLSKSIQNLYQVPPIPISTIRTLFLESWLKQGCTNHEIQIDEIIPLDVSAEVNANYARIKSSMPSTNPLFLWHGTPSLLCTNGTCRKSNCSLCSIVREGFRPENARRETSSYTLFGHSSYFAADSMIAHGYNGKNESVLGGKKRAVILSEVLVKKPLNCASREVIDEISDGETEMNLKSLSRHLRNLYNKDDCDCFLTKVESFPRNGSDDGLIIPVHYMVQDGHRILPRYLVTYTYPERFAQSLPHENNYKTNPMYCEFHGMWHQGEYRQCDHYRWFNYSLALLNYD
jgi:serine/threonine protein kinase